MRTRIAALVGLALVVAGCSGGDTSHGSTTSAPTTTTVATTDWQNVASRYAADIDEVTADGGALVAIWRDGNLHAATSGVQPNGEPIPADAAWRVGSVTKPIVAAAVLRLVDDGVVDLDATASTYLTTPVLPESVTVRDLLGHTSGIFSYTDMADFEASSFEDLARVWDPVELITGALEARAVPESPFWAYSNTNYVALGLMLEEVTGRSVDEVLGDVFDLAGMDDTYLAGAEPQEPAPVGAFTSLPGTLTAVDADLPYTSIATGAWTAGAVVSTADDVVRFLRALFGGDLISGESLDQMMAFGIADYGLGLQSLPGYSTGVFGHSGGIPGFATQAMYSLDRDVAVVLLVTNDEPSPVLPQLIYRLTSEALTD